MRACPARRAVGARDAAPGRRAGRFACAPARGLRRRMGACAPRCSHAPHCRPRAAGACPEQCRHRRACRLHMTYDVLKQPVLGKGPAMCVQGRDFETGREFVVLAAQRPALVDTALPARGEPDLDASAGNHALRLRVGAARDVQPPGCAPTGDERRADLSDLTGRARTNPGEWAPGPGIVRPCVHAIGLERAGDGGKHLVLWVLDPGRHRLSLLRRRARRTGCAAYRAAGTAPDRNRPSRSLRHRRTDAP